MKLLRKYCNSENGLCKLFADAASLKCKMLTIWMVTFVRNYFVWMFICFFFIICCLLLANKVAYSAFQPQKCNKAQCLTLSIRGENLESAGNIRRKSVLTCAIMALIASVNSVNRIHWAGYASVLEWPSHWVQCQGRRSNTCWLAVRCGLAREDMGHYMDIKYEHQMTTRSLVVTRTGCGHSV